MRILLFSDNHGEKENILRIIKQCEPLDRIISLGDSEMREKDLSDLGIFGVKGNYPFEPKFPYELNFYFEGVNCYFTHGHLYHVKSGTTKLLQKAYQDKYEVVAYGHTHKAFLEEIAGIIMINPGALSTWRSNDNPTYALLEITEELIRVTIYNIYRNVIKTLVKKRVNNGS